MRKKIGSAPIKLTPKYIFDGITGFTLDKNGRVTGLSLHEENFSDLCSLKGFKRLRQLDLSDNGISDISCLGYLENLTHIDLSRNSIQNISVLGELKNLEWVNLADNNISRLPADVQQWNIRVKWKNDTSTGIILTNNPLEPAKIISIKKPEEHPEENARPEKTAGLPEKLRVSSPPPRLDTSPSSPPTGPPVNKNLDVFLCHSRKDKEKIVVPFANELKKRNISYWLDIEKILPGDLITEKIQWGLKNSKHLVVFVSKNLSSCEYAKLFELSPKIMDRVKNTGQRIVPVLIDKSALEEDFYQLQGLAYIEWNGEPAAAADQLEKLLSHEAASPSTPASKEQFITIDDSLLKWCIQQVFSDQHQAGVIKGAWSKKYPAFLKALFIDDDPTELSTITFSSWIINSFISYLTQCNPRTKNDINNRLDQCNNYFLKCADEKNGGIGTIIINSAGKKEIHFDIRHTAWALISLNAVSPNDDRINSLLSSTCHRLSKWLNTTDYNKELPVNLAALHRLLSISDFANRIFGSTENARGQLKRFELELINKFNKRNHCWGWFNDEAPKTSLNNALSIMYAIDYESIIEIDLVKQFDAVAHHLVHDVLIHRDDKKAGLPFKKTCKKPDLGTTLHFLYILKSIKYSLPPQVRQSIESFINDPVSREKFADYSFSWHLASVFHLLKK